ncbi:hypothetical protein DFP72DRAFT_857746 [Ephemerocybe angulata]|uniref:Uncharacterized protein n=1 Tax=Ephemerocybe angulata TaxID=980116 RepID=A0A8H6LW23_9AGAR|nr:hypothetical protein DFP72DRAFT_857746 [Tulosesus angulatus]
MPFKLEPNDFDADQEVLSGPELESTIAVLGDICSSVTNGGSQAGREKLKELVEKLKARLNDPSAPFDLSDFDLLEMSNIRRNGTLDLKLSTETSETVSASRKLGSDKLWSDDFMHKHLALLFRSIDNESPGFIMAVTDAFIFRATAMLPPSHEFVLVPEDRSGPSDPCEVPQMGPGTKPGVIDYTVIVASPSHITKLQVDTYWQPILDKSEGEKIIGAFFIAVANANAPLASLGDQLNTVVLEMSARAKSLGKSHVRGALTSGTRWSFIAMDLDPNNVDAKYWVSEEIEFRAPIVGSPDVSWTSEREPSLIAAILSTWVQRSFEEFKGDEWFFTRT